MILNDSNDLQEVHGKRNGDEDPDAEAAEVLLDALLGHNCSCHMPGHQLLIFLRKYPQAQSVKNARSSA